MDVSALRDVCDPEILSVRDRALQQDNLPAFAENLCNTPAFILEGGSDDNVPPLQAHLWVDVLRRAGDSVTYEEVPWKGHWWDRKETPGIDCIDDSAMMAFIKSHVRNPYPKHVHFSTCDLAQSSGAYWVRIDEVEEPGKEAEIDVNCDLIKHIYDSTSEKTDNVFKKTYLMDFINRIEVQTKNVYSFTLFIPPESGVKQSKVEIQVDHTPWNKTVNPSQVVSFIKKGNWMELGTDTTTGMHKTPENFGPMKQATFSPFILVYGTAGDSAATALSIQKARVMQEIWWSIGNGTAPVMADTEVDSQTIATKNLILFGGWSVNKIVNQLWDKLPLKLHKAFDYAGYAKFYDSVVKAGNNPMFPSHPVRDSGSAEIGRHTLYGAHLAAQFIYPNPLNPEKFVLVTEGADSAGEALAGAFGLFGSDTGLPDYIIYDESVRTQGWGGVKAAGFFDERWGVK